MWSETVWVTRMERRELEKARHRGYLVMRERERFLESAWKRWCEKQGEPCVRLVKEERGAAVWVSLATAGVEFSLEDIEDIRSYLNGIPQTNLKSQSVNDVLPIVYRGGVYTGVMSRRRAEQVASFLLERARKVYLYKDKAVGKG